MIPSSTEVSKTNTQCTAEYPCGGAQAFDQDLETYVSAVPNSNNGGEKAWLKLKFDTVSCIKQVIGYKRRHNEPVYFTGTCSQQHCNISFGYSLTVTVKSSRNSFTNRHPYVNVCKLGDTVKITSDFSTLMAYEIAVIEIEMPQGNYDYIIIPACKIVFYLHKTKSKKFKFNIVTSEWRN